MTGFVHGDPHPGNVFVRSSPKGDAEIVLLDHGLYMHVEERLAILQWEYVTFEKGVSFQTFFFSELTHEVVFCWP